MILAEFIDKILEETANETDGTGFLTRKNIRDAVSFIQREISRLTENILATTATTEPAASATTMTIDASGNFLRGVSAYRTYGGYTRPIDFYTEGQLIKYDTAWKTRTGSLIKALLTSLSAEGYARPYPIPDNADNDIVVNYIKLATALTSEYTEAGDAASQVSGWILYGVNTLNTNAGLLYWNLTNVTTTRTVSLYSAAAKTAGYLVAQGSRTGDGAITLSAMNSSGLTGTVTVAYTIDDSDSANILTMTPLEIPEADVPCLEFGVKAYLYNLEKDGKDTAKGAFWQNRYGTVDNNGYLTGELAQVASRARTREGGTYSVMQERPTSDGERIDPLYSWEA